MYSLMPVSYTHLLADGLQEAEGALDVGAQEGLGVGDGVVVVGLGGVVPVSYTHLHDYYYTKAMVIIANACRPIAPPHASRCTSFERVDYVYGSY